MIENWTSAGIYTHLRRSRYYDPDNPVGELAIDADYLFLYSNVEERLEQLFDQTNKDSTLVDHLRVARALSAQDAMRGGQKQLAFLGGLVLEISEKAKSLGALEDPAAPVAWASLLPEYSWSLGFNLGQIGNAFRNFLMPQTRHAAYGVIVDGVHGNRPVDFTVDSLSAAFSHVDITFESEFARDPCTLNDVLSYYLEHDVAIRLLQENPADPSAIPLEIMNRYFFEIFSSLRMEEGLLTPRKEVAIIDDTLESLDASLRDALPVLSSSPVKQAVFLQEWQSYNAHLCHVLSHVNDFQTVDFDDRDSIFALSCTSLQLHSLSTSFQVGMEDFFSAVDAYGDDVQKACDGVVADRVSVVNGLEQYLGAVMPALEMANSAASLQRYKLLAQEGIFPSAFSSAALEKLFTGVNPVVVADLPDLVSPYASYAKSTIFDPFESFQSGLTVSARDLSDALLNEDWGSTSLHFHRLIDNLTALHEHVPKHFGLLRIDSSEFYPFRRRFLDIVYESTNGMWYVDEVTAKPLSSREVIAYELRCNGSPGLLPKRMQYVL